MALEMVSPNPWSLNNQLTEDVLTAVSKLGFESLEEFFRSREGIPYGDLTGLLGGIPPIMLIALAYAEGQEHGTVRYFAIDGLCRNIAEKCGAGWNRTENSDWKKIQALSSWISEVTVTGQNPDLKDRVERIAKMLQDEKSIESGWVPENNGDANLQKAFSEFWPE